MEWTDMMHYQQQMQKIIRSLLPVRKSILTASECELLARLYLQPEKNTPALLSQGSGMKKEAVSRCLKTLYEKNAYENSARRRMNEAISCLSQKRVLPN